MQLSYLHSGPPRDNLPLLVRGTIPLIFHNWNPIKRNQCPVESDPDWMEMDTGPLAGLAPDVAQARYPVPAFRNPYQPLAGTGESSWELYCRAARAVEKVVRRGPGQFLVVAHGGILNAALCSLVGAPPTVTGQGVRFAFGDTGYARTTYYPEKHQWVIRELRSIQ